MIERYSRKEMSDIWELNNKFRIWLDIEIAVCEVYAERGMIPEKDLAVIKEKASFTVDRVLEIENEVHHDVIAFLTAVAENVGPESRHIHFGLTSSDVVDTAFSLQLVQAGNILLAGLDKMIEILKENSLKYKDTRCMGRSHGVHAEPTTFGVKMALYYESFKRSRERIVRAIENISYGKLSGAVGTFSNVSPEIEAEVCRRLGLLPDPVSTQVIQRDRHAEYMSALAIMAGTMDQLATEIRHLQRTEVREVEEPFQKGQKGSSAMPHKRNPILSERVTGLSRVIKSNINVALDNITLWHERDYLTLIGGESHIPRFHYRPRLPYSQDDIHITEPPCITRKTCRKTLIKPADFFIHSLSSFFLLKKVSPGKTLIKLYRIWLVRVWKREGSLKELTLKSPEISGKVNSDEIDKLFDINRYYKNIDAIYKKAGII